MVVVAVVAEATNTQARQQHAEMAGVSAVRVFVHSPALHCPGAPTNSSHLDIIYRTHIVFSQALGRIFKTHHQPPFNISTHGV